MAKEKKKPDTPPGQGGTPPGQVGKPPKPQQYDVRAAAVAVGVAAMDIQLTLAPPVEPPPDGQRHDVAVAVTARGRVMANTWVIPAGGAPDLVVTVTTGSDPLVNGDNFQAAINAAACGDTIVLQRGASYQTRILSNTPPYGPQGSPFNLPNKSCSPGQYVSIVTSALPSLPARRITPADASKLAQIATNIAQSTIQPANGAGNYKFIGIDFTNTAALTASAGNTNTIVTAGPGAPSYGQWSHDMVFDRVWIHPYDDVPDPTHTTRSAGSGIYLDGATMTLTNSYINGFCCFQESTPTLMAQSQAIALAQGPGPALIENNFIEGYGWGIFTGGSGSFFQPSVFVNPANVATITGATLTQATFSQTATLLVGDLVGLVYAASTNPWTTSVGCGSNANFGAVVQIDTINNGTGLVTWHGVGCSSLADAPSLPPNGTQAQWRGMHLHDVTIRKNYFYLRPEWCTPTYTGPKGVVEAKEGQNTLFEGNIVDIPAQTNVAGVITGCSPLAFNVANQDGTSPWATNDGLIIRNNVFRGLGRLLVTRPYRNHTCLDPTGDVLITNNLLDSTARGNFLDMATFKNDLTPNTNCSLTITHNTVIGSGSANCVDFSGGLGPTLNLTFRNNIVASGNYFFNPDAGFPGRVETHNVWINNSGGAAPAYTAADLAVVTDPATIGFANLTGANAGGDYHGWQLTTSSPYYHAGSDGTDCGVNFTLLDAALVGNDGKP